MKGDCSILGTGVRTVKLADIELGPDCIFEFSCPTCGLTQAVDAGLGHRWWSFAGFPIVVLQDPVAVASCDRCQRAVSVPICHGVRARFLDASESSAANRFKISAHPIRAFASWWLPASFSLLGAVTGAFLAATFFPRPTISDLTWWRWLERIVTPDAPVRTLAQIPTWALLGGSVGLITGSLIFICFARSCMTTTRLRPGAIEKRGQATKSPI